MIPNCHLLVLLRNDSPGKLTSHRNSEAHVHTVQYNILRHHYHHYKVMVQNPKVSESNFLMISLFSMLLL